MYEHSTRNHNIYPLPPRRIADMHTHIYTHIYIQRQTQTPDMHTRTQYLHCIHNFISFISIKLFIYFSGGKLVSTEARNTEGIIYYQFQVRLLLYYLLK